MPNPGRKWVVRDRYGHEIYITEERWRHALRFHSELEGHLDDVLDTLRTGRRRQKPLTPNEHKYFKRCDTLPLNYNCIVVVVAFTGREQSAGTFVANNFVRLPGAHLSIVSRGDNNE